MESILVGIIVGIVIFTVFLLVESFTRGGV
jgi:hypothetical protein